MPLLLQGQDKETVNAVIKEHYAVFTMASPTSGTFKVHTRITVLNKHGVDAAAFLVYNDGFRNLSSFSGSVQVGGKTVKKLKKSDLSSFSLNEALASDASVAVYSPNAPYPFDVEYDYEVDYSKGMVSFPAFIPLSDPQVRLESSQYVIRVPASTRVQYKASTDPVVSCESKNDTYTWTFNDHQGYVSEHLMPGILTLVPFVYACPVEFSYAGTQGNQDGWKESGKWLHSLQKGLTTVPDELRSKILSRVENISDTKAKVKAVYDFLRENTRYVSIQLGIGGLRPFPVETVYKAGFGDCKALSVYMQALLDVVGIDSDYLVVNTSKADLLDSYHSVGQMNHAMLCVPMQNDTLWVECTNPRLPLGYRHSSVAGHQVVLVKEEGGEMTRVPDYPDSLRFRSESIKVNLHEDGSATCDGTRFLQLDNIERYVGFGSYEPKDQFDMIMSGCSLNPSDFRILSVRDNFNGYLETEDYVPHMKIAYSYAVKDYAKVSGERMFLQLNPFAKKLYADRKARVNPLVSSSGNTYSDTVRVVLPVGYAVETIPTSTEIESRFGVFRTEVTCNPASEDAPSDISVVQTVTLTPFDAPAEEYEAYRAFAREVSKAYSARVVLKKE